ncbi:hypothetical protein [uncultured Roseibium sp.]|uniref:hypothetical protein n=1 Tax=uncultured Roseibium sp. TaxID=1936171 RepID=UPI0032163687
MSTEPGGPEGARLPNEISAVLEVLRLFCFSYARPENQTWELAMETAERSFGPLQGWAIARCVLRVLTVLRRSRTTAIGFNNPFCRCCRNRLTTDERRFVQLLGLARQGRSEGAQAGALILCEGANPQPLLQETDRLAGLLFSKAQPSKRMVFR